MQVNFLTKLVALKPGRTVQEMIENVMQGKDEGADNSGSDDERTSGKKVSSGLAGRVSYSTIIMTKFMNSIGVRANTYVLKCLKSYFYFSTLIKSHDF